jgi:hypothetical protein
MQDNRAAKRELDRMLSDLSRIRTELPDLERDGKESAGVTNAHRAISRLEEGIRRHCREHGLPLPNDVPTDGEGSAGVTTHEAIDHDAIRTLARDCARHCITHKRCGEGPVCQGAPKYFGCLEQLLGHPYTELEVYEFHISFDAAVTVERPVVSA